MVVVSSGLWARGQAAEIFFENRHGLRGFHVAGDSDHHVGGHVVFVEEFLRVGGGERIQVGHPAHGRPVIGMGFKRGGGELLEQAADGIAVGAHAALFDHDVALFVKLAQHGMKKTLGFEIGPEFEAVCG